MNHGDFCFEHLLRPAGGYSLLDPCYSLFIHLFVDAHVCIVDPMHVHFFMTDIYVFCS